MSIQKIDFKSLLRYYVTTFLDRYFEVHFLNVANLSLEYFQRKFDTLLNRVMDKEKQF